VLCRKLHDGRIDSAAGALIPPMGIRTRGLDIKAGAAKLKADRAARRD
jgi:hypothetical protein